MFVRKEPRREFMFLGMLLDGASRYRWPLRWELHYRTYPRKALPRRYVPPMRWRGAAIK